MISSTVLTLLHTYSPDAHRPLLPAFRVTTFAFRLIDATSRLSYALPLPLPTNAFAGQEILYVPGPDSPPRPS